MEVDDKFPLFFEEDVNDLSSLIDQRPVAGLFVPQVRKVPFSKTAKESLKGPGLLQKN
ncbi:hypothetical protein NSQ61_05400 [Aeribacillus sp. FSL K6-1121]|uniref:hypothetical protein n=1 Tax=Aeribacillus sp. FSL K6-1121 TaxID=2954745 RepID=UPI0030F8646C